MTVLTICARVYTRLGCTHVMLNLEGFRELQKRFFDDARELERAGKYQLAYYLGGYATECAIKAVICKKIPAHAYPPKNTSSTHYVHDIEMLLRTAKLKETLEASKEEKLQVAFQLVKEWEPNVRYEITKKSAKVCQDFLEAVEVFTKWLEKQN